MNKKRIWLISGIVIMVLTYIYVSPYLVLNSIQRAAQAGDSEKVSNYIDYPSVRQSFKDQMNAMVMKKVGEQKKEDGFAALGAMLASTMVDKMVDAVVTPAAMTLVLQGKGLQAAATNREPEIQTATKPVEIKKKVDYTAGYISLNQFEVIVKEADQVKNVKIKLVRDGLSWKVNEIVVPMD